VTEDSSGCRCPKAGISLAYHVALERGRGGRFASYRPDVVATARAMARMTLSARWRLDALLGRLFSLIAERQ